MRRLALTLLAAALVLPGSARAADPLGKAREIVAAMQPGAWRELQDTRMEAVFPKKAGHPAWGVVGPQAVTAAWGGAAFDTRRNILVVTGGGHTDYGGNEVYEFSLESLRWTRATEPSPMRPVPGKEGQFEVADGTEAPVSSHTYDGLLYLPNVDRVLKFGGSFYRNGYASDAHAYLYDVGHRRWTRGAKAPRGGLEVATAYNPASGEALVRVETGLMSYDPRTDRWREVASDGWQSDRVADFDPVGNRLVLIGPITPPVVYYPFHRRGGLTEAKVAGDLGFTSTRAGLAFDPRTALFAIWAGGREVWTLDPGTWQSVRLDNPGGPAPVAEPRGPGREKMRGVYGRWQYVPDLGIFIAYGYSADNVWLYKLPVAPLQPGARR